MSTVNFIESDTNRLAFTEYSNDDKHAVISPLTIRNQTDHAAESIDRLAVCHAQ